MKYFFTIWMILLLALFTSCERDKTPLYVEYMEYTSHDYEWEIDSLYASDSFQIMMSGIWATDENNVWVVGHSSETKYQAWHWDGTQWENVLLWFPGHPHSLDAIYGFSENDIWVVGVDYRNYPAVKHRSLIAHYNGNDWRLIQEIDAPQCLSIWGSNPSNVFVGCDSGVVLHYDGNRWRKQHTGTLSRIFSIQGFSASQVFAAGWTIDKSPPHDSTFYYFFEYDGSGWKVRDTYIKYSFAPPGLFGHNLWASPQRQLYGAGDDGLYLWTEDSWIRLKHDRFTAISGTVWNNIFAAGVRNVLYHFNGERWHLYEELIDDNKWLGDIWCNEKNVFIIGRAYFRSFIYRGKLKE